MDSPAEGAASSEPSLKPKFPASRQNTGNFVDSGFGSASAAAKKGSKAQLYGRIPYAFLTGNFFLPCRELNQAIREL
jgi:hypothetical protein